MKNLIQLLQLIISLLFNYFSKKDNSVQQEIKTSDKTEEIVSEPIILNEPIIESVVEELPIKVEEPSKIVFSNVISKLPTSSTNGSYPKRRLSSISQIVLHHSATTEGTPASFARFHIQSRKWPGIGYHYVIAKNGTVYQTQELTTVSNHVQNANTKSIGICFVGNFDIEDPTTSQLTSVKWLIKKLNSDLKVPLKITKHNQFANKSCPGTRFEKEFKLILEEFQKV